MARNNRTPIHPNAIIIAVVGAVLAVWIAGRNGSVLGGEGFLLATLLVAAVVNQLMVKRK